MDALSDILRALRLTGGVFLQADFSEPWCLHARVLPADCGSALPADADIIPYHYVLEGNLRVQLRGQSPFELSAGQVVLVTAQAVLPREPSSRTSLVMAKWLQEGRWPSSR